MLKFPVGCNRSNVRLLLRNLHERVLDGVRRWPAGRMLHGRRLAAQHAARVFMVWRNWIVLVMGTRPNQRVSALFLLLLLSPDVRMQWGLSEDSNLHNHRMYRYLQGDQSLHPLDYTERRAGDHPVRRRAQTLSLLLRQAANDSRHLRDALVQRRGRRRRRLGTHRRELDAEDT